MKASIHGRLSSVDEASSFLRKVQLHFHLADLLVENVFLGIGLLADLFAAVAELVGQTTASACFFQPPTRVGWTPRYLRDLGCCLVAALMASTATLAFRPGRRLLRVLNDRFSFIYNAAKPSKEGLFFCPENGVHHSSRSIVRGNQT